VIHAQQSPELGVHIGDAGGQHDVPDEQLGVGLVVPSPDRPPNLVVLSAVLEHQADRAVGENAVRPDLPLVRPGPPVEGEGHRLHEGRLPGAVRPEDADHPGGQLQVDLLEHPIVAERELEDPHTVSGSAPASSSFPVDRTRSRSSPARS
jgi:hypothetical protein